MTGELGYTWQEGDELWEVFTEQVRWRFAPTHEAEKALWEMVKVWYKSDIEKYLLEMENFNFQAHLTGVAWWTMIEDQ